LPQDGQRTQAKANDVTRPCALGSRRVEKSSKACSSPSTRAIYAHMDICLHLLPRTQRCSVRVTARARRELQGCQCFHDVDLKGKNIFDPSAEFSMLYEFSIYHFH